MSTSSFSAGRLRSTCGTGGKLLLTKKLKHGKSLTPELAVLPLLVLLSLSDSPSSPFCSSRGLDLVASEAERLSGGSRGATGSYVELSGESYTEEPLKSQEKKDGK